MVHTKINTPGRPQRLRGEWKGSGVAALVVLLLVSSTVFAQQNDQEGKISGNYVVTQSVEFGVHFVGNNGSTGTYESMVGTHTGPRLLEQTLGMRSINHVGALFDNLWMSSFGYGGDPERATRLRMYKNHWYTSARTAEMSATRRATVSRSISATPSTTFIPTPVAVCPSRRVPA